MPNRPSPRFIASSPGTQDPETVRQFRALQLVLAQMQDLVETPVTEERQLAPFTVTEGNSPHTLLVLDADMVRGYYLVAVNFRSIFLQANDRLLWNLVGSQIYGPFYEQANVAGEASPVYYGTTLLLDGPLHLELNLATSGPGAADVEISGAAITVTRVNG